MSAPTPLQVRDEIKALKACKKYAPHYTAFGDDNHHQIDLQIQYLEGTIDTTADEFNEFSQDEQSAILEAEYWEQGDEKVSPSSGWDNFKPKGKRK